MKIDILSMLEWFPDNGLAPFLTGPANITFTLKESNKSFTLRTELYHSPDFEVDWEKINNGEVFEMKYSDFNTPVDSERATKG